MLIVCFTTIPSRFDLIGPTLDSLLRQSAKIDRIILYIPYQYRRFPEYDGRLPEVPEGVEIRRTDKDLGPATKILCAAKEFADVDCDILFCDDDRVYSRHWAQRFVDERARKPEGCIAAFGREAKTLFDSQQLRELTPRAVKRRWQEDYFYILKYAFWLVRRRFPNPPDRPRRRVFKRAGYIDIFMGFGGVMVKPDFFDEIAYDIPDECWSVDDIWLSGMLARKGIGIWIPSRMKEPPNSQAYWADALWASAFNGFSRPAAETQSFEYLTKKYGIWQ